MDIEKQNQLERGKRIKMLRAMIGKNQSEFAELCNVSAISINLWENGAYNGLSKKGAQKIINTLEKLGITCSLAWLWLGMGNAPNYSNSQKLHQEKSLNSFDVLQNQILAIKQETELFIKLVPNSIVLEITDDAMDGYYPGDFIGAVWSKNPPEKLIDKEIVISLEDNRLLVRKIGYDDRKQKFFLYASNLKSKAQDLFVADVTVGRFAEIIRIWRLLA